MNLHIIALFSFVFHNQPYQSINQSINQSIFYLGTCRPGARKLVQNTNVSKSKSSNFLNLPDVLHFDSLGQSREVVSQNYYGFIFLVLLQRI